MRTVTCEYCSKVFQGKRPTRRFCSKLCISRNFNPPKGFRKRKPETKEVKYKCAFCSKDCVKLLFKCSAKHGHKAKYCNQKCMVAHLKAKAFSFSCKICGTVVFTQPAQIKYRNRETCSVKCRSVMSRQKANERRKTYTKHQLDRLARYSKETTEWRKAVFARDNYTCQFCGIRGSYLEADHIKPFAYFPELRYDLSNGRTLCRPCHDKTKVSYQALRKIYAKEAQAVQEKFAEQAKKRVGIPTKTSSDKDLWERLLHVRGQKSPKQELSFRARSVAEEHTINGMQIRLPLYEDSMHGR